MASSAPHRKVRRGDSAAGAVILCLLAGIGLAVWWQGRSAPADVPGAAAEGLQPAAEILDGYHLARTSRYDSENLYEYIDGQAPFYQSFGFRALTVAEYDSDADSVPLAVDCYWMGARRNAYGIFFGNRSPEDASVEIGNDGAASGNLVAFWKGPYYVRVRALTEEDAAETAAAAARAAARWFKDDSTTLREFDAFPSEGLVEGSKAFYKSAPLGLGHLSDAFLADYSSGDGYRLLFCDLGDDSQAFEALRKQAEFVGSRVDSTEGGDASVWGSEKYIGAMLMVARGGIVASSIGIESRQDARRAVDALIINIEKILKSEHATDAGE